MDALSPIEDERGVDIGQIQSLLRMPVEERVRHMVEVANKLMEIRATARFVDADSLRDRLRQSGST